MTKPSMTRGSAISVNNITRSKFRSLDWWTPTSGVRLPSEQRELSDLCDATLLAVPQAVISGPTAAALWGLPMPLTTTQDIEITVPNEHPEIRRPGVHCRRRDIPPRSLTVLNGRPLLTPARLFVDFGRELQLAWLVAYGDAGLRAGLLDHRQIVRALAESRGHRGICRARQALTLLDARAESPRESIMRVLLVEVGIIHAVPQFVVTDKKGRFVARVDLGFVEERVAIEYDGAHHLTPQRQALDALRRQRLEMLGWLVVTVNREDIHRPQRLITRVRTALASRT